MSIKSGGTLIALLSGIALGAGAGILFAPDKGSKTRGKIKGGYDSSKEEIVGHFDDLAKKLKSGFGRSKKDFQSSFEDLVGNAKNEKEELIEVLETKLRELKKSAYAGRQLLFTNPFLNEKRPVKRPLFYWIKHSGRFRLPVASATCGCRRLWPSAFCFAFSSFRQPGSRPRTKPTYCSACRFRPGAN